MKARSFGGSTLIYAVSGAALLLAGCAQGEYRMPYQDGTVVDVYRDHVSHSSPEAYMYDLMAQNAGNPVVVAAAPGWVRFIDDSHEEPTSDNNYVWIEHPYPFCPKDPERANWPGKPSNYNSTCIPCNRQFCNEWTTYAHMTKGSVRGFANLSEGDWVEAGDPLGYEDDVGDATIGQHLHWHVAVIPPDTQPSYNGYYLDYVNDTGIQPEVIPVVCHTGGQTVLWRFGVYTAAGCPLAAMAPGSRVLAQPEPRTALASALRSIATVSDEGVWIALNDPKLLLDTRRVMARMEPDFADLLRVGRARISAWELQTVLDVMRDYERRGSAEFARVLAPIRKQLESPSGRQSLGIAVDGPFQGLD